MYKLFLPQLTFPSSLKYSITNKNFAKLYQQIAWPYITYHDSPWISIIKRFKMKMIFLFYLFINIHNY